jgi:hypothetical protein
MKLLVIQLSPPSRHSIPLPAETQKERYVDNKLILIIITGKTAVSL